MSRIFRVPELARLIEAYFSDPNKTLTVKKGEKLLEQGVYNDRLYLVLKGGFMGYVQKPDERQYELFGAEEKMFVGVYSFFSRTFVSMATVVASEDSEVAFIDQHQPVLPGVKGNSLAEQFMPLVVANLAQRHQREQELFLEKEEMLRKLAQSEKLASLGQMAAGIAHELNNAVAVMARHSQWLREKYATRLLSSGSPESEAFVGGLDKGRPLSTRQLRVKTRELIAKYKLSSEAAEKLAEMGWTPDEMPGGRSGPDPAIDRLHDQWEIGATFHEIAAAAELATEVVRSVRALAARGGEHTVGLNINETIREALTLLQSPLRKVSVVLDLAELPPLAANRSECVQVWTNLIQNALESMAGAGMDNGRLEIITRPGRNAVRVEIRDNGPGIAAADLPKIFQPDFSTKEKGLDFGLGLGLSIVERIVHTNGGKIQVRSRPGETVFAVIWPGGENNVQT
jgi:signal transduction histidine kinase